VATALTCPHCQAQFGFDDWSKAASCPACGRRVSFFAASGRPEPAAGPAEGDGRSAAGATVQPGPIAESRPSSPVAGRYTLIGKPLVWTRGWTIVVVVWLVAAAALGAARVSMGHMAVLTPHELAAVTAVREAKVSTGATNEDVLRYLASHDPSLAGQLLATATGKSDKTATATWYAFDRPWEHRVYVTWQLPARGLVLSWTVENGQVRPDTGTRLELSKAAQALAHPTAKGTLPAVPGIIPSIPPGL